LEKYKLDLVAVQKVRWDKDGTLPGFHYTFFHGNGNVKSSLMDRLYHTEENYQQLRAQNVLLTGCHI